MREDVPPVRYVLHQPEEDAIRLQYLAALHEREPVIQALAQGAFDFQRLLVRPVALGHRRWRVHLDVVEAGVVAGRLADQLIPRIEAGRHVPDRLGHRQVAKLRTDHRRERQTDPLAQQAMIVVDELHDAVVETLVIRHVCVGRVNAHRLARHLGEGTPLPHEPIQHVAGALLIARENALFEPGIVRCRSRFVQDRRCRRHGIPQAFWTTFL